MVGEESEEKKVKDDGIFKVTEIYMYVQQSPDGKESVVTILDDNIIMPCITASDKALPKLRKIAQAHVDKTHCKVALLHFTGREEMEVLEEILVKPVDQMMFDR